MVILGPGLQCSHRAFWRFSHISSTCVQLPLNVAFRVLWQLIPVRDSSCGTYDADPNCDIIWHQMIIHHTMSLCIACIMAQYSRFNHIVFRYSRFNHIVFRYQTRGSNPKRDAEQENPTKILGHAGTHPFTIQSIFFGLLHGGFLEWGYP